MWTVWPTFGRSADWPAGLWRGDVIAPRRLTARAYQRSGAARSRARRLRRHGCSRVCGPSARRFIPGLAARVLKAIAGGSNENVEKVMAITVADASRPAAYRVRAVIHMGSRPRRPNSVPARAVFLSKHASTGARLRACRGAFAGKHGRNGKEPLGTRACGLVVVHECERTFPQFHDRHVGRVPRSSKAGNTRAALTVEHAITWARGKPSMMNFDMTFGKSMTLGLSRELAVQSVERVSGQKPCLVARSTTSHRK